LVPSSSLERTHAIPEESEAYAGRPFGSRSQFRWAVGAPASKVVQSMRTPRLLDKLFPFWLWRLPRGMKRIVLTFDDGPDEMTTPALLDLLQQTDVKVTFFLTGERVRQNSELIKRMAGEGHVLGNHGFHHESHRGYSADKLKDSIQKTEVCLTELGILPSKLFRPPYGAFSRRMTSQLRRLGYRGVMWTAQLHDWQPQSMEILKKGARRAFFDGSIVMLHDGHTTSIRTLLQVLPPLIEEFKAQGLQFVALTEQSLSDS
jgi:peptidoglycan/xylan/chitin deacetylase (PgdA/CDA1 family)